MMSQSHPSIVSGKLWGGGGGGGTLGFGAKGGGT